MSAQLEKSFWTWTRQTISFMAIRKARFFHGYHGNYCYLPLYIFIRDWLRKKRTLKTEIVEEMKHAETQFRQSEQPARVYEDFYCAR